jgi:hypothetical protein
MASARERSRRINQGVFISGASGSGKSRMTARLASPWKRVIYIDPMNSFDAEYSALNPRDAAKYLGRNWAGEFSLKVTFKNDGAYVEFFGALLALMEASQGSAPNFLLVIDEVDLWSAPKYIDASLSRILRYGRHYGCSWIANCRADVHTNRDVRMNAQEILLFRQGMLSDEMRKQLADAEEVRELKFPRTARLAKHTDDGDAEEGVHFLALPEPFDDWFPTWETLAEA